jgi:hypothetical protein
MHARVPQDVDLEDRLIYGLSPLRFGYVVIAVLAALSLWRVAVLPAWLRVVPCLLLVASGALLAWGRWRGRALDLWLLDLAVFVRRNRRVGLRRGVRRAPETPLSLRAISAIAGDREGAAG